MFRKDTARFRKSFGPDGWAPPARPVPVRHRPGVGVGGDDDGPGLGTGTDRRGWQAGSVGVSTLPPPHPPAGALACPDRTSQVAAPTGSSTGVRSAVRRQAEAVRVGAAAGDVIGSSGSPGWWWRSSGAAGESRSGRTGRPSYPCATGPRWPGCTLSGADLVPAAGRKPRPVPRRSAPESRSGDGGANTAVADGQGQTVTTVSAGSTSVHEEPVSAERVTASSTSWTCNASAKDGAGSVPVAIASMRSRIWCVKECS